MEKLDKKKVIGIIILAYVLVIGLLILVASSLKRSPSEESGLFKSDNQLIADQQPVRQTDQERLDEYESREEMPEVTEETFYETVRQLLSSFNMCLTFPSRLVGIRRSLFLLITNTDMKRSSFLPRLGVNAAFTYAVRRRFRQYRGPHRQCYPGFSYYTLLLPSEMLNAIPQSGGLVEYPLVPIFQMKDSRIT